MHQTEPQDGAPQEAVPALLLGPTAIVVPEQYSVERGILASHPNMEAVVVVFHIKGHEIRFALAGPNALDLAKKLTEHANEARDFKR